MSAKQNQLVQKAKNSISRLQGRVNSFKKQLPFSNDNCIGKMAQIQAWEDISMPYNQFFGNGIHE